MKKPFIRALGVGLLFVVVYYAFQLVQGMYNTVNYVPDIIKSYETVDYLQKEVAIGSSTGPVSVSVAMEVLGVMLLGVLVYYVCRMLRRKKP